MNFAEMIFLAVSLSIDSLAVSMSGGASMGKLDAVKASKVSLSLAFVQTAFYAGGFFAGEGVRMFIEKWGAWLGFALLLYVGGSMIYESIKGGESENRDFGSFAKIVIAAVATSIDAIAVGASLGLSGMGRRDTIILAILTFIATIIFCLAGLYSGRKIGEAFGRWANLGAGVVLIIIGVLILVGI